MKKSELLKKLIEEIIEENLEEIQLLTKENTAVKSRKIRDKKDPLDNDINKFGDEMGLTALGKQMVSLHIKHPTRHGTSSQQKARAYFQRKFPNYGK